MSDNSAIEWTDATWNPTRGCDKVSPGCKHCYAETFAERFRGVPGHAYEQGFDFRLAPDKLDEPLRWKKPRKVFVNSMSDLFHKETPDDYLDQVFAAMAVTQRHTYQVLTKRADRLERYMNASDLESRVMTAAGRYVGHPGMDNCGPLWPLPNVWLGVSVEDQERADERIPQLLRTPAAVRFLSCEPLLGPVDLAGAQRSFGSHEWTIPPGLHWVIIGGESGAGARPFNVNWARTIIDDCRGAGVPVFCKQLGAQPVDDTMVGMGPARELKLRDRKGGDPAEWPAELRIREWPEVRR